jgi:hypothetical protein
VEVASPPSVAGDDAPGTPLPVMLGAAAATGAAIGAAIMHFLAG